MKLRLPRLMWIGLPTTVLVAIAVGLQFGIPAYQQLRAIEGIRNHGKIDIRRVGPTWLRMVVGEHQMSAFDEVERAYLALVSPQISDTGIGQLEALERLEVLQISYTRTTDRGLQRLRLLSSLKTLLLDHTQISDEGIRSLVGLTNLEKLSIDGTEISDDGLRPLRDLPKLAQLNIACTHVTDTGLKHLARLSKLESLDLSSNRVSDEGLRNLKGLTTLRKLRLADTHVTDEGIAKLKQALPTLRLITRSPGGGAHSSESSCFSSPKMFASSSDWSMTSTMLMARPLNQTP